MRVIELGQGVAAAYTAKLLADLGADVIKFEPPGGDLARPQPETRVRTIRIGRKGMAGNTTPVVDGSSS